MDIKLEDGIFYNDKGMPILSATEYCTHEEKQELLCALEILPKVRNFIYNVLNGSLKPKSSVNDFIKTLEKYKFSIVIENHNSYISEKLFDSLSSGCITIYVGPNLVEYGLDKNIAIQSDSNAGSILNYLKAYIY